MVKKTGSVGRFGARYGRKMRNKVQAIEKIQYSKQKCPYCNQLTVKRISSGIWHCKKCDSKFAGKAYRVGDK
ncbi:MAG: 50S ribosomal protein L37ae [archaeon]